EAARQYRAVTVRERPLAPFAISGLRPAAMYLQSPGFSEACDNFASDPVGSGFRACSRASARLLATDNQFQVAACRNVLLDHRIFATREDFRSGARQYRAVTVRERPPRRVRQFQFAAAAM